MCASARVLRVAARATRTEVAAHVLRSPTRRMARVAHGGSEDLPETRERRCPCCQSDLVKHSGRIHADNGLVKSEYHCNRCERPFLLVRRQIGLGDPRPPLT